RPVVDRGVLRVVVLPVEVDRLLGPQLADEPDRLAQPRETLLVVGPLDAEGALVQVLPGADAEDHATRVERAQRAEGLGDDPRVKTERRRVDRGPESDPLGALSNGGEPGEGKRRVAVGVAPRLEVVADGDRVEP